MFWALSNLHQNCIWKCGLIFFDYWKWKLITKLFYSEPNGQSSVLKGCMNITDIKHLGICYYHETVGWGITDCNCDTDLCNGSLKILPQCTILVVSLLVHLFL